MRAIKGSFKYIAAGIILLSPIYPNVDLLGGFKEEKITDSNNIKSIDNANNEIKRLLKLAIKNEQDGSYKDAIFYLEKVLVLEKKFFTDVITGDTFNYLGNLYRNLYNFVKAENMYKSALEIKEKKIWI